MAEEQNGAKVSFHRRFKTGCVAFGQVTLAFYVCMFKGVALEWWKEYATIIVYIAAGVILGLSATDFIRAYKQGK